MPYPSITPPGSGISQGQEFIPGQGFVPAPVSIQVTGDVSGITVPSTETIKPNVQDVDAIKACQVEDVRIYDVLSISSGGGTDSLKYNDHRARLVKYAYRTNPNQNVAAGAYYTWSEIITLGPSGPKFDVLTMPSIATWSTYNDGLNPNQLYYDYRWGSNTAVPGGSYQPVIYNAANAASGLYWVVRLGRNRSGPNLVVDFTLYNNTAAPINYNWNIIQFEISALVCTK